MNKKIERIKDAKVSIYDSKDTLINQITIPEFEYTRLEKRDNRSYKRNRALYVRPELLLPAKPDPFHYKKQQDAIISHIEDKLNSRPFYKAFTFNTKIDTIDMGDGRSRKNSIQALTPYKARHTKSGLDHRVIDGIWRTYFSLYRHIASQLIEGVFGRASHRKAHLLPFTYDWIDLGGTRGKGKPDYQNFPHIHSVWLIHPDTADKWTDLISQDFKLVESFNSGVESTWRTHKAAQGWNQYSPSVESFEAEEINNLPGWVRYASKLSLKAGRAVRNEYLLYSQQPLSTRDRELLKQERQEIVEAKREEEKLCAQMTKQNPQLEGFWTS
jgi:hypothetical protein